jgi:hypothetical protein
VINNPTNPRRLNASPKTDHNIGILTRGAKYCKGDTRAALRIQIKYSIKKNNKPKKMYQKTNQ